LIIPASAKDISMEKSPHFKPVGEETSRRRMERAGVWLTSTNTIVAELVGNWATPQRMALVPLLDADPPMLPVY
jgi:hypothetical protein